MTKEQKNAYMRMWRAKNKEKVKDNNRASHQRHQLQRNLKNREWYAALGPEQKAEHQLRSRESARNVKYDTVRLTKRRCRDSARHARLNNAEGTHTVTQWLGRITLYGWRCAYCLAELTAETLEKDHVIALACGGSNWAANLVPACRPCNRQKQTKRWTPRLGAIGTVR